MNEQEPTPPKPMWWVVPAAVVLLLLMLAILRGETPPPLPGHNSYDAGKEGFRATYLVLEELGYPVTRSRKPLGGKVRWVLYPLENARTDVLDTWVREGGRLLVGDPKGNFVAKLGLSSRAGIRDRGRTWGRVDDKPLVNIHDHGRGEIWLLHQPDLFFNKKLRDADHAVQLCGLADAMLQGRGGPLAFDEFAHGMRDRPGVMGMLLEPPMSYLTIASLSFTLILIWRHATRFGQPLPDRSVRRRSKEEFLDAMAELLQRKADYRDAYDTVRQRVVREIETELGLGAGVSLNELLDEAERRWPTRTGALREVLRRELPDRASRQAFLTSLNNLEKVRNDLFQLRKSR